MNLSVIIPTKNEEDQIEECLRTLRREFAGEILVVDGESSDATAERAESLATRVLVREPGLARQCNAGVAQAKGDILFFVAADCRVPQGWFAMVREAMEPSCVAGGGFQLQLSDPNWAYRWIEWGGNFRSRYLRIVFLDQGLFVRKDAFLEAGGMPEGSLIPFASLCFVLHDLGQFRLLPAPMNASVRKWKKHGRLHVTWQHQKVWLTFVESGFPPATTYRR